MERGIERQRPAVSRVQEGSGAVSEGDAHGPAVEGACGAASAGRGEPDLEASVEDAGAGQAHAAGNGGLGGRELSGDGRGADDACVGQSGSAAAVEVSAATQGTCGFERLDEPGLLLQVGGGGEDD